MTSIDAANSWLNQPSAERSDKRAPSTRIPPDVAAQLNRSRAAFSKHIPQMPGQGAGYARQSRCRPRAIADRGQPKPREITEMPGGLSYALPP